MITLVKDTVFVMIEEESVVRVDGGNAVCPRGALPGLEAGALESCSGPPCVCFCLLVVRSASKGPAPADPATVSIYLFGAAWREQGFYPKEFPDAPCLIRCLHFHGFPGKMMAQ